MKKSMKKVIFIVGLLWILGTDASAQFQKDVPSQTIQSSQTIFATPSEFSIGSFIGNILDDKHFQMNHSYTLSYNSMLGNTTGEYVNTMIYKFDAPVMIRADVGVMHQPFGASQRQLQYGFGPNDFSGVYLKNAQVLWQPTKNMTFSAAYQQVPPGQWFNQMGFWGNGWGSGFNRFGSGFGGSAMW